MPAAKHDTPEANSPIQVAMFAAASVLVAVGYYAVTSLSTNLRERDALHHAPAYLEAMALTRQYYAETIVPRIKQNNVPISHHYKDTERALPVPATVSKDLFRGVRRVPGFV